MAGICKPNCVTTLPAFGAIDTCDLLSSLSSGEIAMIIFAKCNRTFTDIDDANEWETHITNGDITIPFIGNGKIDEQAESGEIRIGCTTVSTTCKKPFEFSSPIVDNTSQTEWALYNSIVAQRLGLGVMFLTCDNILLVNPDWVTTRAPSMSLSSFKVSQIFSGEADGKMSYKINGEIAECRSLKRVKLSQDTIDIITSTNTGS
jgi:hypothetical protein